ncbi:adenylate/guanylate cyclase domain-containing protein [Rhodopila globiformis]|nr:adenylate/guanylate cyclase domain-containing protein [Rhodopila globiformis]
MNVAGWLQALGMERYAAAFRENDVDPDVLLTLTADDLKELGVTSIGHRRRLLEAIAALRSERIPAEAPTQVLSGPLIESTGQFQTSETTAERRPLTVMFCDLIGSTALSARLDLEDLREVIRSYQACVAATIQQFNGFIARYVGDGVLIYFGWPKAHETDAARAVRAGLAVAAAVSEAPLAGQTLQVRIGIATGLVVVGEPIGSGDSRQQTAIGETPNRAARLQGLAGPGQVVIDAATRRQIGGLFDCRELGAVELKGLPEPVPAWQVVSENRTLGQFEALRSGQTPLIGREEELDLLLRRWTQAKGGTGKVVLIAAEPGVGKSRLAEALAERIAAEPHVRLRYFCSPHHQDSALYPVIAQMERAAGFAHGDAPEVRLTRLQALLAEAEPSGEDVALVAELHGLPSTDLVPPLDPTPQRRKEKIFEALLRQVEALARQRPVLMVFDDLHWIDPSSRELLDRLIARVANWPVLLLALFRPEFQPSRAKQPQVTMLSLARLDRRDTTAMVASLAGNTALPAEIIAEITERTDGVPLFVEELTKAVLEAGADGPVLTSVPHPAVPATLHASLLARLDRLGPAAKDVAQTGATIGREFGFALLASVTDLPEPELRAALDRLANAGLLFVRGTPPQSIYLFKHAMVQDAAYGISLRSRRQRLHARIVASLEVRFPETVLSQPALLAQHCAAASLTEQAIAYWLKAGQQAMARAAMAEAISQLRKGLYLVPKLSDSEARQQQELDLQIALGRALIAGHGYTASGVGETYARARLLCDQLGDKARLVLVMFGQYLYEAMIGKLKSASDIALRMLSLGEMWNDNRVRYLGCRCAAVIDHHQGEFVEARTHFERTLSLYNLADRAYLADLSAEDPHCATLLHFSWTLACLGYLDQARKRLDQGLSEARQSGRPDTLASSIRMAWVGDNLLRSTASVWLERVDELSALSINRDLPFLEGVTNSVRSSYLAASGYIEQGIALLRSRLATTRAAGNVGTVLIMSVYLAELYGVAGLPQDGLKLVVEAEGHLRPNQGCWWEAEMHRLRGQFLYAIGERTEAEASFQQGLVVARRQSAKLFELRTAMGLARFWRDQGKRMEARDLLSPIYRWFTEGFDTPDLRDAKALLEELA